MTNFEKVKEFHRKHKLFMPREYPIFATDAEALLRVRLMTEELAEAIKAISLKDMPNLAKELADLLVVTYGTADYYGINIDAVFDAVHESNMTKTTNKDSSGKILKGDNYIEPKIEEVLQNVRNS